MAYQTYTTTALVCGSKDSYTSDRSYLLFTDLAGMVWASARSVRTEGSKQRYALQDFSITRVSLVKGKTGWKIGSVEALGNPFLSAIERAHRTAVTTIVRQLRRYVHGEDPHPSLFKDTIDTIEQIVSIPTEDLVATTEVYTVRLLNTLGYVGSQTELAAVLDAETTGEAMALYETTLGAWVQQAITTAEQVSHL